MEETQTPDSARSFSWLDPHPTFVIILVGPDETPFGIQKDFLCAKSSHYRAYFAEKASDQLENVVKLPETTTEVFGLVQSFLFTNSVFNSVEDPPGYDPLVALWKLGNQLGIEGLCDAALEAMTQYRNITQHIPATPLLVQAWNDTPKGSSIRELLLNWAAEYIRSSESRSEFSKSLPQEILSELVVRMSNLSPTIRQVDDTILPDESTQRKTVHYLDTAEGDGGRKGKTVKHQPSDFASAGPTPAERKSPAARKSSRSSLHNMTLGKARKSSLNASPGHEFTPVQKLSFCSDLLTRMLSGPGFWTRLVGPFRNPVNPTVDGVPDYLGKISKPMDLGTIKKKMDRQEYKDEEEFAADVRLIFSNCFTYWTEKDPMWAAGKKLEKTFEEKYAMMSKWLAKMEAGEEI